MSKRRELIVRRKAQQQKQTLIILGVIGVLFLLIVGGAIILSARSNAPRTLVTVNNPPPANAEKNGRAWGPADAPIKIVEFVDMQCPGCGQYVKAIEPSVISTFAKTGLVRYEVRMLSFIGQESKDAAKAALCAMDQDKFWQMHDTIFANQGAAENAGAFSNSNLKAMARSIGVDTVTFDSCLDSAKYDTVINQDRDEGTAAGVDQTPTTVINGKKSIAVMGPDDLKRAFAEIAPDVKFP